MKHWIKAAAIALGITGMGALIAQANPETKPEENPLKGIEVHAMVRVRPEHKQYVNFVKNQSDIYSFVGQKAWVTISKKFDDKSVLLVTIQDARIWGGQTASVSATDTSASTATTNSKYHESATDIREAYLDLKDFPLSGLALQIGRQKLVYGDQRLVGALDWSNVGRSFDAARLKWDIDKTNSLHVFTSVVQEGNANDSNNVAVATDSTGSDIQDRMFSGIYDSFQGLGFLFIEPYYLHRGHVANRTGENLHTAGMRLTNKTAKNKKPDSVAYDVTLEGAYQYGKDNSAKDVDAYAGALAVGYTIEAGIPIRIGLEGDIASGDTSNSDNINGTFTNLYHTNHMHYGIVDLVSWQNMIAGSLNFTFFFTKNLAVELAYWYAERKSLEDNWYGVSGSTFKAAGLSHHHELYHSGNLQVDYKARDYLSFGLGYSYALRGKFLIDTGADVDHHVGYLFTTVQF